MSLRAHWVLDEDVVFLNHGSFGACPRPVLDAQHAFRARWLAQSGDTCGHQDKSLSWGGAYCIL